MRYLHTMLRVRNLDAALKFYRDALGLEEVRRMENDKGRFTLVFLAAPEDRDLVAQSKGRGAPLVELTYNWEEETYGEDRFFGHLAYEVDDIYATCERLMKLGITINRPPICTRSGCCRKATRCRRRSRGPQCRISATGRPIVPFAVKYSSRNQRPCSDLSRHLIRMKRGEKKWVGEFCCGCWACRSR